MSKKSVLTSLFDRARGNPDYKKLSSIGENLGRKHLAERDFQERYPLHYAALNGHTKEVIAGLTTDLADDVAIGVKAKDSYQRTPLHEAAISGHVATVAALIADPRVDVNAVDGLRRNPLHLAAINNQAGVVSALLAHHLRVNVNNRSLDEGTPLYEAVQLGHTNVVSVLIADPRVDVNTVDRESGMNALHMAIVLGHQEIIAALIANPRVSIEAVDDSGKNALQRASESNSTVFSLVREAIEARRSQAPGSTVSGTASSTHLAGSDRGARPERG